MDLWEQDGNGRVAPGLDGCPSRALRQSKASGRGKADTTLCLFHGPGQGWLLMPFLFAWFFVLFNWEMKEASTVLEQCKSLEL